MVAIMTLHMIQVFLFGAYKYPREMTWISGIVLLLLTLGMAFTGKFCVGMKTPTGASASALPSWADYPSSAATWFT